MEETGDTESERVWEDVLCGRRALWEMELCRVYSSGSQLGWKGGLCPQVSHLAMPEAIFHAHNWGWGVRRGY